MFINLFSDTLAQRLQILVKKAYLIFQPYGNRKSILEILCPTPHPHVPQQSTLCICAYYQLSLYTLYVSGMLRHGGEGGGDAG